MAGEDGVRAVSKLPDRYGVTALYMVLRVAARFAAGGSGGSPIDWFDRLNPGEQAVLLEFEEIRQREEAMAGARA